MRAVVYERYGSPDVLDVREVPEPAVGPGCVLVRVHAVGLNRSDWETLTGRPAYVRLSGSGLRRPRQPILGSDVAGTVTAVGDEVTGWQPGDEVLADTLYFGAGGLAEFVCIPARAPIVAKPAAISFEQAAALPQAAVLARQGLRGVEAGAQVAIVGAGGGGGTFAVQLAAAAGAEVTGVDHTSKLDLMRTIGAEHVVDYTCDDYTRTGRRYHRILDFVGARPIRANRRALQPGGSYLVVGGSMPRLLVAGLAGLVTARVGSRRLGILIARPDSADLADLAGRVAAGTFEPVIDRRYQLAEAPEAFARLGAGRARGKLVVTVGP